jgi:hypothetical protein
MNCIGLTAPKARARKGSNHGHHPELLEGPSHLDSQKQPLIERTIAMVCWTVVRRQQSTFANVWLYLHDHECHPWGTTYCCTLTFWIH